MVFKQTHCTSYTVYIAVSLLCSLYQIMSNHHYILLTVDVVSMIHAVIKVVINMVMVVVILIAVMVMLHNGTCKSKFHYCCNYGILSLHNCDYHFCSIMSSCFLLLFYWLIKKRYHGRVTFTCFDKSETQHTYPKANTADSYPTTDSPPLHIQGLHKLLSNLILFICHLLCS